jgi:glycosyltransferase involved in cell wall biosynthesis
MQNKLRVLFIVNDLRFGGAEKHVVTLLNNIDTSNFALTLVHLKDRVELLPQIEANQVEGGIVCANVGSRLDLKAARSIARIIDTNQHDVVVCTNSYPLMYGWLARWFAKRRIPLVEVFHTTALDTWKLRLQMAFYRPFFRAADLVVFVCEMQRTYWRNRRLTGSSSLVIHNGIDVERFHNNFSDADLAAVRAKFGFSKSDFVVGICAALRPEKAHVDLLDAFVLLRDGGNIFKCLIIGDGPEREKIERAVDERRLREHVVVTGLISDVRKYVAACDVMTLVSHSETFSLATLEAMALSKPIIMSEVGGAPEQVIPGHNGLMFQAGDIEGLAKAILEVKNANANGAMGVNARRSVVSRFGLKRMVSKFEQTFLEMARGREGI